MLNQAVLLLLLLLQVAKLLVDAVANLKMPGTLGVCFMLNQAVLLLLLLQAAKLLVGAVANATCPELWVFVSCLTDLCCCCCRRPSCWWVLVQM
jgi:hypothetical protein